MIGRSDAARLLGSLPKAKRYARACPICGREFQTNAKGVYCSMTCRSRAQTRRKTAARRARWEHTEPNPDR
jgi:hypothetical protein